MKKIIFFALAVAVSLPAAHYRWGDSVHASGYITGKEEKVRAPRSFESGLGTYFLTGTARILAPYRGDARVVLEGLPEVDHDIYLSSLALDLGVRVRPRLGGQIVYNLRPGDKINLHAVIREPADGKGINGRYTLSLYDTRTDQPIYRIPLNFIPPGESGDGDGER